MVHNRRKEIFMRKQTPITGEAMVERTKAAIRTWQDGLARRTAELPERNGRPSDSDMTLEASGISNGHIRDCSCTCSVSSAAYPSAVGG
jgi:hypothetical protein